MRANRTFTVLWLSLFFGILAVDRFYLGYWRTGLLKLSTLGGLGIWVVVDWVRILRGRIKDKQGRPLRGVGSNPRTVKIAVLPFTLLMGILTLLAISRFFISGGPASNAATTNTHISPWVGLLIPPFLNVSIGYTIFILFTIVEPIRRKNWTWGALNLIGLLISLPLLNVYYYFFMRDKRPTKVLI